MTTSKVSIARFVEIAYRKGIRQVVFSPGSRNAPMVIAFTESEYFNCICIPDERVAAFYALGMALQSQNPVIICCTSGSAALNYAPAICEAYYQYIPLVVVTADRPIEWIDQGIGQSIRQNNIYSNYVKGAFQFIQDARGEDDIWYNDRIANEAINLSIASNKGPVHINIPLREPLYEKAEVDTDDIKIINQFDHKASLTTSSNTDLLDVWKSCKKKIILLGLSNPNTELSAILEYMVKDNSIVLLTETCSNVWVPNGIQCIDRVIDSFEIGEQGRPDLVVTMGGPVISKKVKKLFKRLKPKYHWDVRSERGLDTFQSLTHKIDADKIYLLGKLKNAESLNDLSFQNLWLQRNESVRKVHDNFLMTAPFSDLKAFSIILNSLKGNINLHLSNSAIVRYAQLFDQNKEINYFANRGVSGIDGSTSTALGFSYLSPKQNILISGDMSFFYDSNAFWHHHVPDNFKIILINNAGGGIFRIIPGPDTTSQLENYFEAHHDTSAEALAKMYGFLYTKANDILSLGSELKNFLNKNEKPIQLLEVFTPREENSRVLMDYFENIKTNS